MPTFGYTTIGASDDDQFSNESSVSKEALSENGDVSKLTIYAWEGSGTANSKGLVYDDNSNYPNNLKGTSNVVNVNTTQQWHDYTFSSAISLTTGDYWLGLVSESVTTKMKYDTAAGHAYEGDTTNSYSSPKNPHDDHSPASSGRRYSVYATYTAGGAGTEWYMTFV